MSDQWRDITAEIDATPLPGPCTIDLDCQPGFPRPGDLIDSVLEGTGLPSRPPVLKFFGNWQWDYNDMPEVFEAAKPILKERITALYHAGLIRYGSW
jgi:hypothetical protein